MVKVNESNSMVKVAKGAEPDPLVSAMNAAITQYLGGTNYTPNPMAQSVAPEYTPPSMQVRSPGVPQQQIPLPTANPMFHAQSPIEYDLGELFRQNMLPESVPTPVMPPMNMMAIGEEQPAETPPPPTKKPSLPAKPERAKGKGGPSTEPKQVTPPPRKKRMLAGK